MSASSENGLSHHPFTDLQYDFFPVGPVEQYSMAYTDSIFATDPANALRIAQRQLRKRPLRIWTSIAANTVWNPLPFSRRFAA